MKGINEDNLQKKEMDWPSVLLYIHLHALGIWALYLILFQVKWATIAFVILITLLAGLGVTAGAHRLWAHGAYKASAPLRIFLMLAHTLAGVGSIHDWVINHRIHHKYYGTEHDPYNHKKGFFYSHIIANVMTSHPEHEKIVKSIDLYDIEMDGYVWIQHKFYWILVAIVCLLLPINAPAEYWGESIFNSFMILGPFRLLITAHISWLVNSAAVIWGLKPGEKYPCDDNTIFILSKSHWPHYHYLLPWDVKSGEFGTYDRGCTTTIIKIFKNLGLASELKTATSEEIQDTLAKMVNSGKKIDDSIKELHKSVATKVEMEKLAFHH